ncbi:MAG: hypothetical protein ABJC12_03100 [Saprospiraceae bacterium]
MISILPATEKDALILSTIGSRSLIESHGHSAPEADIHHYVINNMSEVYPYDQLHLDLTD